MKLILASQSPRRKELMGLFHIPFVIRVADVDETMDPNLSAAEAVAQVSHRKAEDDSFESSPFCVVMGSCLEVVNGVRFGPFWEYFELR